MLLVRDVLLVLVLRKVRLTRCVQDQAVRMAVRGAMGYSLMIHVNSTSLSHSNFKVMLDLKDHQAAAILWSVEAVAVGLYGYQQQALLLCMTL